MWTPYDWELAAVKRDMAKCEEVSAGLEGALESADSLEGNASVAQASLNQCFGTEADASEFADGVTGWFDSALSSIAATLAGLAEKAESLESERDAYIEEAEAAAERAREELRRRAEEWTSQQSPYWYSY